MDRAGEADDRADARVDIRHHADFRVPEEGIAEEGADDFDGFLIHVLGEYDAVLAVFPPERKDVAFFCFHKMLNFRGCRGSFSDIYLRCGAFFPGHGKIRALRKRLFVCCVPADYRPMRELIMCVMKVKKVF